MPCFCDTPEDDIMRLKKVLDETTALLCSVLMYVDAPTLEALKDNIPGLTKWKNEHDEFDKARLK
jgi:hypothetical protein